MTRSVGVQRDAGRMRGAGRRPAAAQLPLFEGLEPEARTDAEAEAPAPTPQLMGGSGLTPEQRRIVGRVLSRHADLLCMVGETMETEFNDEDGDIRDSMRPICKQMYHEAKKWLAAADAE